MGSFEEALKNIDVFCKALAKKITENDKGIESDLPIEPVEKLLRQRYVAEIKEELSPPKPPLIPLPQLEQPLIDVFEDEYSYKVLLQCRCRDEKVMIHTDVDSVEICKRECFIDSQGVEVCADNCQRLDLPPNRLQIEKMITKCNNNEVFEIEIPKKN
ncbi:MAG: hypothetical protein QHH24_00990 [Candidatus Bathyarchaeota archaeon]|jgi:hypothetical protein|nr:hypothetical protein [Candidatus Bathyarchaeota archaeon]